MECNCSVCQTKQNHHFIVSQNKVFKNWRDYKYIANVHSLSCSKGKSSWQLTLSTPELQSKHSFYISLFTFLHFTFSKSHTFLNFTFSKSQFYILLSQSFTFLDFHFLKVLPFFTFHFLYRHFFCSVCGVQSFYIPRSNQVAQACLYLI